MFPILILNRKGVVTRANAAAERRFGPSVGAECFRVVRARNCGGDYVCDSGCPVLRMAAATRETRARVRGRACRLVCSPIGEVVVVTAFEAGDELVEPLTEREREVLSMVSAGHTSRRIAEALGISFATVRTHVEHARAKLGAHTRAEAVARALALGILEPPKAS